MGAGILPPKSMKRLDFPVLRTGRTADSPNKPPNETNSPASFPGTGIMRHVDAGYDLAEKCAREEGIRIPMLK